MHIDQNVSDLLVKPFPQKKYDAYLHAKCMRYKGGWLEIKWEFVREGL